MFSLSYLPTAERLTVVVVKARNLKFQSDSPGDAFVKVSGCLISSGREKWPLRSAGLLDATKQENKQEEDVDEEGGEESDF
jgi:hypothetical protein